MLFPVKQATAGVSEMMKMKVPGTKFEYSILIGEKLPNFTFVPSSFEIIQRLILKAAFVNSLEDLSLYKS